MTRNTNSTRYYSAKQENAVAKIVSGRVSSNSGASMFQKGDVRTDDYLIECKTSVKEVNSVSIKKDWLTKIKQEAFSQNKSSGIVAINFGPDTNNYFIIDEQLFKKFLCMEKEMES